MAIDDPQRIRWLPPLLAPQPSALTAADGVGQGSVIPSHRPEPNIQIATRLAKTPLSQRQMGRQLRRLL
jgi:hypothetical protein